MTSVSLTIDNLQNISLGAHAESPRSPWIELDQGPYFAVEFDLTQGVGLNVAWHVPQHIYRSFSFYATQEFGIYYSTEEFASLDFAVSHPQAVDISIDTARSDSVGLGLSSSMDVQYSAQGTVFVVVRIFVDNDISVDTTAREYLSREIAIESSQDVEFVYSMASTIEDEVSFDLGSGIAIDYAPHVSAGAEVSHTSSMSLNTQVAYGIAFELEQYLLTGVESGIVVSVSYDHEQSLSVGYPTSRQRSSFVDIHPAEREYLGVLQARRIAVGAEIGQRVIMLIDGVGYWSSKHITPAECRSLFFYEEAELPEVELEPVLM